MIEELGLFGNYSFQNCRVENNIEKVKNESRPSPRSSMRRLKAEGQVFSIQTSHLDELMLECEQNSLGWPALHWAIEKLHRPDVALAILERSPEEASKILPSPYRKSIDGEADNFYSDLDSALSLAVANGYEEVVLALLKSGIDPNEERISKMVHSIGGHPPHLNFHRHSISLLGLAFLEEKNSIVKMLLAYGAALDVVDYELGPLGNSVKSAWMYAYERYPEDRELVRLLLEASIKEKNLPQTAITEADINLVMKVSKRLDGVGCPPLNGAFAAGDYEGAKRLIELGVYDDLHPLEYRNPWISEIGNFAARLDVRFLDLLLDLGYVPEQGSIGLAVYCQNDGYLARLLERGIEIKELKDSAILGRSPKLLELALSRSFDLDLKAILLEASRQGCKPALERILEMGIVERSWIEEAIVLARRNHQDEVLSYLKDALHQMD